MKDDRSADVEQPKSLIGKTENATDPARLTRSRLAGPFIIVLRRIECVLRLWLWNFATCKSSLLDKPIVATDTSVSG